MKPEGATVLLENDARGDAPAVFSRMGHKLTQRSGIVELMDDLGRALADDPGMLMLGGGNPAAVPEVRQLWRESLEQLLDAGDTFDRLLANYEPPGGNPRFLKALAEGLQARCGWPVTPDHLAVTNGAQTGLFFLFNMLAGPAEGSGRRRILLPISPEYIGYADQGIEDGCFVSCRPTVSKVGGPESRRFKYHIDFEAVESRLTRGDVAAIAVSRPTNPTGNVLEDRELYRLSELTVQHRIHLIVDGAYGLPFPGILFTEAQPLWGPHVIQVLSLSKLGLPGTRTGLVVGPPALIRAVRSMTAIVGLTNSNLGQQIVLPLIETGELFDIGPSVLQPFYRERSRLAQAAAHDLLDPTGLDWRVHVSEGAFFLWFWFPGLPIPTSELYRRLKARHVLVVPGEPFFFGLQEPWTHSQECLRLSFAQSPETVREGIRRLAEELQAISRT
jgi:valine--pyruvate aminotransferase